MIVADTDVLIDALRGRQPTTTRVAEALSAGALATTTITEFELLSGARDPSTREAVERLLAPLAILPFDSAAASSAAAIRRALQETGEPIGTADYLIAGICLARSLPLLTRNRRHFGRVPGLLLGELKANGS